MEAVERRSGLNIYTIPQTTSFLDGLANAILAGDLPVEGGGAPDRLELTRATVLLPTRRACRVIRDAFLRASKGDAVLLPRIQPIGEVDEEASLLEPSQEAAFAGEAALSIPPAVSDMERHLILTAMVMRWSDVTNEARRVDPNTSDSIFAATPAQASALARELSGLMDMVETESADLSELHDIVPEIFSEHWQLTLEFLKIVTEHWPAYLREGGLTSPMDRRNRLLLAEAARLAANPPAHPVIAAGITGSIPAAAILLKTVAHLPQGAVILPGLDLQLDEESWGKITDGHPEHPQYTMKRLLDTLGAGRDEVRYVARTAPGEALQGRLHLVSETLRPAETTDLWTAVAHKPMIRSRIAETLTSISAIAAPSEQDEAEAVSLIMRHAVETPGKTAALVTPDRILARRVSSRLLKWGLMVDDSAGRPLSKTVPGTFLDHIAGAVNANFAPSELMALLKHPLTLLGMKSGEIRAAARTLELVALRRPRLEEGLAALGPALRRTRDELDSRRIRTRALQRLSERDWTRAADLLVRIEEAFAPWIGLIGSGEKRPLQDYAAAHIAVAETLAQNGEGESDAIWSGEAGETIAIFLTGLLDRATPAPDIAPAHYPDFYRSLVQGVALRAQTPVHPRLFIWGPLEARLQHTDIVILGGLNEGTWPQAVDADPWLNRPMRQELGLPAPEQHIGHSAQDFGQLLGASEVFLTRAAKVGGVPTVASRWLLRMEAFLNGIGLQQDLSTPQETPWLGWARARDNIEARERAEAPAPCPPVATRPRRLSVTEIETWIKNPYAIFARHILRLEPLPELGAEPDAALRGRIIHQALHRFTTRYPLELPNNVAEELLAIADEIMAEFSAHARVAAFWRPRFERFSHWFAATEGARRKGMAKIATEISGALEFDAPGGEFVLIARADRIDLDESGQIIIYDYKTGAFPSDSAVKSLRAPQLPLEAAIAHAGGFEGLNGHLIANLGYISASGGEPAGKQHMVKISSADDIAEFALAGLKSLVALYDDSAVPYRAARRPGFDYRFDDYDHLARTEEWAVLAVAEG
ncbi:hypothetical protein MnTg02_03456 [bacterium MnTg02]|nr:hypothetical protein MnTg02_03456 [bacterium MnTg02]